MNCTIKPYGNKSPQIHLWLLLRHNKMLVFHICPYSKSFMHISNAEENKYRASPCIAPTMSEGKLNIRNMKGWLVKNKPIAPSDMECDITGHQLDCGESLDVNQLAVSVKFSFSCTVIYIFICLRQHMRCNAKHNLPWIGHIWNTSCCVFR